MWMAPGMCGSLSGIGSHERRPAAPQGQRITIGGREVQSNDESGIFHARGCVRKESGCEDCETFYAGGESFEVNANGGEIDRYSVSREAGVSVRVFVSGQAGVAYTERLEEPEKLVDRAIDNAKCIESTDDHRCRSAANNGRYPANLPLWPSSASRNALRWQNGWNRPLWKRTAALSALYTALSIMIRAVFRIENTQGFLRRRIPTSPYLRLSFRTGRVTRCRPALRSAWERMQRTWKAARVKRCRMRSANSAERRLLPASTACCSGRMRLVIC